VPGAAAASRGFSAVRPDPPNVLFDPPDRVLGVDVSVAAADAGDGTWIADGRAAGDRLRVDSLSPATALDGGPRTRAETLDALVALVRSLDGDAVVGFDFPFGVPADLLDGGPGPAGDRAPAGPDATGCPPTRG